MFELLKPSLGECWARQIKTDGRINGWSDGNLKCWAWSRFKLFDTSGEIVIFVIRKDRDQGRQNVWPVLDANFLTRYIAFLKVGFEPSKEFLWNSSNLREDDFWHFPIDIFQCTLHYNLSVNGDLLWTLFKRGDVSSSWNLSFSSATKYCIFALRSFLVLTNSAYPDEMQHDSISPVCKCKKHVPKNIFHIWNAAEYLFKVISCSIHVCIHLL